jgi:hypothetical protein
MTKSSFSFKTSLKPKNLEKFKYFSKFFLRLRALIKIDLNFKDEMSFLNSLYISCPAMMFGSIRTKISAEMLVSGCIIIAPKTLSLLSLYTKEYLMFSKIKFLFSCKNKEGDSVSLIRKEDCVFTASLSTSF